MATREAHAHTKIALPMKGFPQLSPLRRNILQDGVWDSVGSCFDKKEGEEGREESVGQEE